MELRADEYGVASGAGWFSWPRFVAAMLLVVVFCMPALLNRHPIIYPDSIGYYQAGSAAVDAVERIGAAIGLGSGDEGSVPDRSMKERGSDGTSTARSPYYGAVLVVLTRISGEWALPLAQVVLSITALMVAAQHLGRPRTRALFVICGVTGLLAGLGVFSTALMPDVFAGLAILAIALLLSAFRSMSVHERIFWVMVLLVSCLFHKANLATSAVLIGLGAAYLWISGRRDIRQYGTLLGVLVAAGLGHLLVNVAVERMSGRPPVQTPFLLARLVGDGTAERFLRKHCPRAGFILCRHLNDMPMTENQFLWSGSRPKTVMRTAPLETREAITRESDVIVKGVLAEFPVEQAQASASNAARQFFDVGIREYGIGLAAVSRNVPVMHAIMQEYDESLIARRSMPLEAISRVMLMLYVCGFVGLALLYFGQADRVLPRKSREIAAFVVAGVAINAAVSGVIAGVFDRYQGRVAWLVPFVALLLWLQWRKATTTTSPAAP